MNQIYVQEGKSTLHRDFEEPLLQAQTLLSLVASKQLESTDP
jgi:hypothetical protein